MVGGIAQLASAAAVPMLIVDYSAIIDRYSGLPVDEIAARLEDDDELLECLSLPIQLGVSEEWTRLYGFPIDNEAPDLITRSFSPEAYPDLRDHLISQLLAPFQGVSSICSEHLTPTLAGDVTVRSHWKAPVVNGSPDYTCIVIVDLDVSDMKEAERHLEEAIESKDHLMSTLSHELRNPLTAVVGFTSLLTSDWDSLDEETRREMANDIASQLGDVSSLLEDFLTYKSGEAYRVDDDILGLQEVIDGVDLGGFETAMAPDLVVRGDAVRLRQIIRNLVRNAQRHGGANRSLTAEAADGTVMVLVSDDGPGVPPDVVDRLFQAYAHGPTTGSLGLGLAVSRTLAEAMGGDLRYRRESGITTFELQLRAGTP